MVHVVVMVLGDVGRSPRMQYHAVSFASKENVSKVTLIGYKGANVIQAIAANNKINVVNIPTYELSFLRRISFLHAVVKGILLVLSIFWTLLSVGSYELIVIQNPPCLPAVISAYLICVLRGGKVLLDWHNIGYMMFQERLGDEHILVKMARLLEKYVCRLGTYHICVSATMSEWLRTHFGVNAKVLKDGPPPIFRNEPLSSEQKKALFQKYNLFSQQTTSQAVMSKSSKRGDSSNTNNTNSTNSATSSDDNNTAVVVSSTSWTADEDFSILLGALVIIEKYLETHKERLGATDSNSSSSSAARSTNKSQADLLKHPRFRKVTMIITGKGPMQAEFIAKVTELSAQGQLNKHVAVHTPWLEHCDYPLVMRSADLGVCLHTSTSGLDLPMKVYDMLGSGVPVLAVRFDAIGELVRHNYNGLIFGGAAGTRGSEVKEGSKRNSSEELAKQMIHLLIDPDSRYLDEVTGEKINSLSVLRQGAGEIKGWDENWEKDMPDFILSSRRHKD